MAKKNKDLHGSAPDSCPVAVLLVDVINDLDFPGSEGLLAAAKPAARKIAALLRQARGLGVPVVYANDNFGRWRSDLHAVIQHCVESDVPGRPIAKLLRPGAKDYLVLKPKHSAFFASTLETLLRYLEVDRVVLAGFAGNICVLFTANDLYMRDYELYVPEDCCASNTPEENAFALRQMKTILKADVRPSAKLDLAALKGTKRTSKREVPRTARRERGGRGTTKRRGADPGETSTRRAG